MKKTNSFGVRKLASALTKGSLLPFLLLSALLASPVLAEEKPMVATLHPLLSEMVETLAGDAVRVVCLMPPTSDPHTFDPKPSDLAEIQDAKLVVAMGKHLEHYLDRLQENMPEGVVIYEAGRKVPSVVIDPKNAVFACCPEHTHGAIDPHWWHSPVAMRRAVRYLGRELEDLLPDHKKEIRERTRKRMDELEELDEWAKKTLADIPADDRKLVTAHAAFSYFCKEYNFLAIPVKGLTPERNASPGSLSSTITTLKEENVRVVFPEKNVDKETLNTLKASTGVVLSEPLVSDNLGEKVLSYDEMFRHNINTIVNALSRVQKE